jgi:hypothetical protein
VQAKRLKGGQLRLSGKEWIQHELLAWLPSFTFVDSGYDPRPRALNGVPLVGSPHTTSEYGGINLVASPREWTHWFPDTSNLLFKSPLVLAKYLAGMVVGDHDCGREALPGGPDDWSFTVDELLTVTAAKLIVKSNKSVLRGNNNIAGYVIDTAPHLGGGGGAAFLEGDEPEWPEGQISTVQMILSRD